MRLELESTCSSWIGIRKLLSERQKTEILYKAEGEGKVKAWTSLVSWMRWHLWATFGSVVVLPICPSKEPVQETRKIHFFLPLLHEQNTKARARLPFNYKQRSALLKSSLSCVCKSHIKKIHFHTSKIIYNLLRKRKNLLWDPHCSEQNSMHRLIFFCCCCSVLFFFFCRDNGGKNIVDKNQRGRRAQIKSNS